MKKHLWAEHLTTLPKRGVGALSSVFAFDQWKSAHVCLQWCESLSRLRWQQVNNNQQEPHPFEAQVLVAHNGSWVVYLTCLQKVGGGGGCLFKWSHIPLSMSSTCVTIAVCTQTLLTQFKGTFCSREIFYLTRQQMKTTIQVSYRSNWCHSMMSEMPLNVPM